MFDQGILFVGAEGIGLGLIAEAIALDELRRQKLDFPVRVYSATLGDQASADTILMRAVGRAKLETNGLSLKPLALFAFAGAPRVDHVIGLGTSVPSASKLSLGDHVRATTWQLPVEAANVSRRSPGERYAIYQTLIGALRSPIHNLLAQLQPTQLPDDEISRSA